LKSEDKQSYSDQDKNLFIENDKEKEFITEESEKFENYQNAEKILTSTGENLGEINEAWDPKYDKLLEAILEFHKFDFLKATEEINRIMSEIENKFDKKVKIFNEEEIRNKWTEIEVEIRGKEDKIDKKFKDAELEELE
jgi:hypothetical protein